MSFIFKKRKAKGDTGSADLKADEGQNADESAGAPPAPEPAPVTAPSSTAEGAMAVVAERVERQQDRSLYKSLLAGLYDAVLIIDPKGFIIGSNPRVEAFFGYSEGDLWDTACVELIPKMTAKVQSKVRQHTETGRFTVVNATGLRKDGTSFPAEIAISRIHLLHDGDLIFSVRNLERREKARLRHEMELGALQHSAAGIVVCRADGRIEYTNPSFLKLLQYDGGKDVVQAYIGDFCTSVETVTAMIRTPSTHGSWMGTIEMTTSKGVGRDFLATSAMSHHRGDGEHLVLTLTPLPRTVVSH